MNTSTNKKITNRTHHILHIIYRLTSSAQNLNRYAGPVLSSAGPVFLGTLADGL